MQANGLEPSARCAPKFSNKSKGHFPDYCVGQYNPVGIGRVSVYDAANRGLGALFELHDGEKVLLLAENLDDVLKLFKLSQSVG